MDEKFFKIDMLLEQVDTKRITKTRLIKIVNEIQSLINDIWCERYGNKFTITYFSLRGAFYMIYGEFMSGSTPRRIKQFIFTFKSFYEAFKAQVTKTDNGKYKYVR